MHNAREYCFTGGSFIRWCYYWFCFVLFCFVAVKVRDYRVGAGEKVAYSVGEFA